MKKKLVLMRDRIWFGINIFCTVTYLLWRIFFTIPYEYGWISIFAGVYLLIIEALGMVEAFVHYANMSTVHNYALPKIANSEYPDIDIFISTYSEETALLYKTINGCKHMSYPDKRKVHIYLCDDGHRAEMKALALRMGVHYLDRPDHKGQKAGNLNNALAHTSSPLIVTFDADMIPKSDFLLKTVPYFVDAWKKNEGKKEENQVKLCIVQTPQAFYNPDLFQYGLYSEGRIPNEQDYFYRDIQVARTKSNSVIYGGSNTVILRKALEDIGGFYTEAITEDFATGILMEKAGYVSLGLGEPLASGMSPTDLPNLVQQRVRWARGVIATGRKMKLFRDSDLSFAQKMNYWASVWYWYAPIKRLIYILAPMIYAVFAFQVFKCTLPQILLFWLPMFITSNISLSMLSGNIRNSKWTGIYETALFPYMLIPVILESFGITLKKFKVTDKSGKNTRRHGNPLYIIPFVVLIVLSVIGIIRCILIMFDSGTFGPIVVLFWLVYNLYLLVMSLFFIDGRANMRSKERVPLHLPVEVRDSVRKVQGVTKDISEDGASIVLDTPHYFDDGIFYLEMSDRDYRAKLKAEIVYVNQVGENEWIYSCRILDYLDTYDDWLQILYDRIPLIPDALKRDAGVFEDLQLNTTRRVTGVDREKRNLPRVKIEEKVDGVLVEDFNYQYVTLRSKEKIESINLEVEGKSVGKLMCGYIKNLRGDIDLYEVMNLSEFVSNRLKYQELLLWLMSVAKYKGRDKHKKKKKEKKTSYTIDEIMNEKELNDTSLLHL